ncbi:ABC transporter substrate-binding protein [Roseateles sp.]|uniref:ABC transporter substrate-binding protein n=1 Tax=Roseateles sp. TaxID=1971397 RepID=UPI0025D9743C|nr:ABC transporter substrate-binding protein [Roseateles sp.]MBV8037772.1 ABC transporter substrate-binding protein [Roseateles sp.]
MSALFIGMTTGVCHGATTAADSRTTLVIATRAEPNAMDPQFSTVGTNQATAMQMFEPLFTRDAQLRLQPALALSATRVSPTQWEFALRPNVKFHDGQPFDAEDVRFSLDRAANVPNSPAPFRSRVANISKVEVLGPLLVRVTTRKPDPQALVNISTVMMVSSKLGARLETQQFNAGRAAIGTGPYRFVRWVPADRLELLRFDQYWGDKPDFERVTVRYMTADAARLAALESGTVDLIDAVPVFDLESLKHKARFELWQAPTVTLLYLGMELERDVNPSITDIEGRPLKVNPLKDLRVRQALSLAIDREQLVDKLLDGMGIPANQVVPKGTPGFNGEIPREQFNLQKARSLLAQAGYPRGFRLTLHAPNNRYPNDALVAQGLAIQLAKLGIQMQLDTVPKNVFLPRASKREYGFYLYGFGAATGEALHVMRSLLASPDPRRGFGSNNRGHYRNALVDRLLEQASAAEHGPALDALVGQAAAAAFADVAIIPLYHQQASWAGRPGLAFTARRDERTLAQNVSRAPTPERSRP